MDKGNVGQAQPIMLSLISSVKELKNIYARYMSTNDRFTEIVTNISVDLNKLETYVQDKTDEEKHLFREVILTYQKLKTNSDVEPYTFLPETIKSFRHTLLDLQLEFSTSIDTCCFHANSDECDAVNLYYEKLTRDKDIKCMLIHTICLNPGASESELVAMLIKRGYLPFDSTSKKSDEEKTLKRIQNHIGTLKKHKCVNVRRRQGHRLADCLQKTLQKDIKRIRHLHAK